MDFVCYTTKPYLCKIRLKQKQQIPQFNLLGWKKKHGFTFKVIPECFVPQVEIFKKMRRSDMNEILNKIIRVFLLNLIFSIYKYNLCTYCPEASVAADFFHVASVSGFADHFDIRWGIRCR